MYTPDIFGKVRPAYLWAAFHGIARRLNLSRDEQQSLLQAPAQPVNAPPPDENTAERIQIAKDWLLHTDLLFHGDEALTLQHIRSPSRRFNGMSSLEFAGLTPNEIRQRLPNGVSEPHLNMYWLDPGLETPHMGLEVVTAAAARVSGGPYALPPPAGLHWSARLIRLGQQP